jgi:anthranilate phosphoribosyltransferase
VVHGEDGLDEITITGKTMISELNNGKIINYTIQPEDFGMMRGCLDHVICDSIQDNADKAMAVLNKADGAKRDIVLLNAGAAIYIAGRAESIAQGIELAKESIDSGRAISTLKQLITMTK